MDLYALIVLIGAYQCAWWVVRFLLVFYRALFGTQCTTERYGEDSWAVVTGSTDGIGKEAAKHLASQGFNVVLVSRSLDKLNTTAKELQQIGIKTGKEVRTRVIALDMTAPGNQKAELYERIYKDNLIDIDISVLINNAGYAHVGAFTEISDDDVHKQLTCNTYPVALLTQQVIKSFKQRYEKVGKRSLLASTSSIAGFLPIPFAATYSASKRFVDFFTWSLREELSTYGVDVCAWQAATVKTKMTGFSKGAIAVTPASYAQQSLARCTSGAHAGAFMHEVIYAFLKALSDVLPVSLIMSIASGGSKKAAEKVKQRSEKSASKQPYRKLD